MFLASIRQGVWRAQGCWIDLLDARAAGPKVFRPGAVAAEGTSDLRGSLVLIRKGGGVGHPAEGPDCGTSTRRGESLPGGRGW